jgi:hypothetical protein
MELWYELEQIAKSVNQAEPLFIGRPQLTMCIIIIIKIYKTKTTCNDKLCLNIFLQKCGFKRDYYLPHNCNAHKCKKVFVGQI